MNGTQLETLDQVRQFLEGTETVSFQIESKHARYRWLQHTLVKFRYLQLNKTNKGMVQMSLFDTGETSHRLEQLMATLDNINRLYGKSSIHYASGIISKRWHMRQQF